jgi:LmbE family N-acetylglucosaminyl deacetylase
MVVLILCAHPDDEVFGVGATIAKYAKAGQKIVAVIFSSGASSNPLLKPEVLIKIRKEETKKADKLLGISKTIFLDLTDAKIASEFKEKKLQKDVIELIKKINPSKIFTHSIDDPHPDHHAVYDIVTEIVDKIKFEGDVYCFDVWNPINVRHREFPRMYVDVSDTFKLKIKALKIMKSQRFAFFNLISSIYFSALKDGLFNKCKYAERFVKIR